MYTTLHYTTLHYTTLHYTTLHYTTLHYTTLHYTTLHYCVSKAVVLQLCTVFPIGSDSVNVCPAHQDWRTGQVVLDQRC